MADVTNQKAWQFKVNNTQAASGNYTTDCKAMLLALKNALKGFVTLPWVVKGSGNRITGGMDGVDRWTTTGDIVPGTGGLASWIVLEQAAIGLGFQVLLCADYIWGEARVIIGVSPAAGFTGGSASARPTASDEYAATPGNDLGLTTSSSHFLGTGSSVAYHWHAWQSTDGECTRAVVVGPAGNPLVFWMFDRPRAPVGSWPAPHVAAVSHATGNPTQNVMTINGINNNFHTRLNALKADLPLVREIIYANSMSPAETFTYANELDTQSRPLSRVALAQTVATRPRGRHGELYDFWNCGPLTIGTTHPLDGSKTHAVFGDFAMPWNGSTPLVGTTPATTLRRFIATADGSGVEDADDGNPPVITNVSPAAGVSLTKTQPVSFRVTDTGGLGLLMVIVRYPSGLWECAIDHGVFAPNFAGGSSILTAVTGGYDVQLLRSGGWPSRTLTLSVRAGDGNVS